MFSGSPRAQNTTNRFWRVALFLMVGALVSPVQTPLSPAAIAHNTAQNQAAALRLEDFEQMALKSNPTFAQAEAAIRAAEGRRVQAGLLPKPIVGYAGEELAFRAIGEKSEHLADWVSAWFVPLVVLIAVSTFIFWALVGPEGKRASWNYLM